MDYVTRQFINLTKKLRDDFRKSLTSLGIDLHDIKNAIQSIDKNAQAQQQKEQPKPEVVAILHEPESVQAQRKADGDGTKRRDRIRLLVEWLTLFAVIFYGYMAVRQWREQIAARHQIQRSVEAANRSAGAAEAANTATQERFRGEQRPYLWADPRPYFPVPNTKNLALINPAPNGQFDVAAIIDIKNAGHSPAIDVVMPPALYKFGPKEKIRKIVRDFRPQYQRTSVRDIIVSDTVVAPPATFIRLTKEELAHLEDGTWEMYVVGGVLYRDIFSPAIAPYETTYCFELKHFQGATFADCDLGKGHFRNSLK